MQISLVLFVCIVFSLGSPVFGADCGQIVPEDFEKWNDVPNFGYYLNPNRYYSLVIPKGVVGLTNTQPVSQNGFGAVLSRGPKEAFLSVEGDPGAWIDDPDDEEPRNLERAVRIRMGRFREDNVTIVSENIKKTKLDGLPAIRVKIIYMCPNTRKQIISESIYSLVIGGSFYEITLQSTDAGYKNGVKILESIAKSWKFVSEEKRNEYVEKLLSK